MPRLAKVGNGWGGTEDYATLALWESAESGIDYGVGNPINAQCKGHVGTVTTLSSTPVNGAEIYTDGVVYDGSNGNDLAVADTLTIAGDGYHVHDIKTTSNNAYNRTFTISTACDIGTFERMLAKPDIPNLLTDAFRVDCQSNDVVVRNIVIDGQGANDGVYFRYGDFCDIGNITVINAQDAIQGSNVSTVIKDSLAIGISRDIVSVKTIVNCADSTTHALTDLVDPNNGDYRIKSTSTLVGLGIGAFFEPVSGVTEVDTSYDAVMNLFGRINTPYDVDTAFLERVTGDYDILTALVSRVDAEYDMQTALTSRVDTGYDLNTNLIGRVNKSYDLQTDMLGRINKLYDLQTDLLSRVSAQYDVRTSLIGRVNKPYTIQFDLLEAGDVQTPYSIAINLLGRMDKAYRPELDFLGRVDTEYDLVTRLLERVSTDFQAKVDFLEGVDTSYDITMTILGGVDSTYDIIFDIESLLIERTPAQYTINVGTGLIFTDDDVEVVDFSKDVKLKDLTI